MKIRGLFSCSILFILLFVLILSINSSVCFADLPSNYISEVSNNNLDWYFDEEYLDIDQISNVVSSWFDDDKMYSFDEIESNPVVIAVIDSGINYEHEIFNDVLLYDNSTLVCKDTTGGNSINDDSSDKHGTHVAGIIAILIHKLNLEKYIKILPIKAGHIELDLKTHFDLDDFEAAIKFADIWDADVVNMSLSSTNSSFGKCCDSESTIYVAAAGNNGKNSDVKKYYPAASSNVIGVMNYKTNSEEETIELKSSSNYGSSYELCAPGTSIYSADGSTLLDYKSLDGTSMASPFVSFGAALTILKYRAIENVTNVSKSISEIKNIVKGSSISMINGKYPVYNLKTSICGTDEAYSIINIESGCNEQIYNYTSEVTYSVKILPSYLNQEGDFKWFVNDVLFSTDSTLEFTPSNIVQENIIRCEWVSSDNKYTAESYAILIVKYYTITDYNISSVTLSSNISDDVYISNKEYTFNLNGIDDCDPSTYDSILWYVNNVCVSSGRTLVYVFNEKGNYIISAKINGAFTTLENNLNINVNINEEYEQEEQNKNIVIICCSVFGSIFGVGLLIGFIYIIKLLINKNKKA